MSCALFPVAVYSAYGAPHFHPRVPRARCNWQGMYSLPVRAQLPPRLERCLPYPTLADEIRDMTTTEAEETVKAKATVDDVRIEGTTHMPYDVQRQLTISILETEFAGEPDNWLSGLEEVGIDGFLRNHGYFRATSRAKA